MPRRAVALAALLLSVPLYAALSPGAEVPVSAPVYGVPVVSNETREVATDGTDFLAIWRDETPGRNGLYATIVGENREARPSSLLSILPEPIGVYAVWTGSHYLVALTPYLQPSTVLHLNRDGEIIAPARVIDIGVAELAWNGERALAIVNDGDVRTAALLDAEGNVIRAGIPLPEGIWTPRVEAANDAFILVWIESLSLTPHAERARAVRISAAGDVSAPVELLGPLGPYIDVDIASDGEKVGVVLHTGGSFDNVIRRYTIDDALHVDAGAPLALENFVDSNVAVVATPRGFVAAYMRLNNEALRTVAFGSTNVGTIDLAQSPGSWLRLLSNGEMVMGFWSFYPPRAMPFDASLTRKTDDAKPIPIAPVRQDAPLLASAGETGLVTWNEYGTLNAQIIDGDGRPLVTRSIATGALTRAAVFTGQVWLIAYAQESGIKVQRMSPAGELLGDPLRLNIPRGELALASNGSVAVLIVADAFRGNYLRLVRFSPNGERLDTTPLTLTEERAAEHPEIAANDDGFLVIWSKRRGYSPRVVGKRLDASGNPMDAEPFDIATGEGYAHTSAKVASDGTDYVVTYVQIGAFEIRDPPSPDDPRPAPARVFTKRVLATGVVADGTANQEGSLIGFGTNPAIIHDGERYVLTHTKQVAETLWLFVSTLDVKGAPLSVPRQLVRAESYTHEHGLAEIGGVLWTAYSRVVAELEGVQRVFLRDLTEQTARRRGSRN